jgi:hypothetical protein
MAERLPSLSLAMAGSEGTGSTVYSQLDGRQRQYSKSPRLDGREASVLVVDNGRQHSKSPRLDGREASVLVVNNGYKCVETSAILQ